MMNRLRSRLLSAPSPLVLQRQQRRAMCDEALALIARKVVNGEALPRFALGWARFV